MTKVNLTVSVPEEHLPRFGELVAKMKNAGFEVEQELRTLGVVTGSIDSDKMDDLRRLKGIGNIEQPRTFQVPPPDSDIQ
jgi:hypothetical protein